MMDKSQWLTADGYAQNRFLLLLKPPEKLQAFLCGCCRRLDQALDDDDRRRVSRMAKYFLPSTDEPLLEVWDAFHAAVDAAERHADGAATKEEAAAAGAAVFAVSQHYGDIAGAAPSPGQDPNYDDVAVFIGSDAAAAAEAAAVILPVGAQLCVRVIAALTDFDRDAYYADAEDDAGLSPDHPHMIARREELSAQWKLLEEIFGETLAEKMFGGSGPCIFSGLVVSSRIANGQFVHDDYINNFRDQCWLDEDWEFTDKFFLDNPTLQKVVGDDGHIYFEST